jgi:hypothetical protein
MGNHFPALSPLGVTLKVLGATATFLLACAIVLQREDRQGLKDLLRRRSHATA